MTLDTRKIPPTIGNYLAGFTDGEGSFNLSFRKRKDYSMPWKISLCFNVSQRDKVVLTLFKKHLRCGTLRMREDGVWYYEVNNFTAITENVIPFFDRFGFLSAKKKRDFAKFKKLAELISMDAHLSNEGIQKILEIRRTMNDGGVGKRKYSEQDIMSNMELGKSSETIRQACAGTTDSTR
jgi:LAGLIDADG endonuclease